jgi:hypothetical protein
MLVAVAMSCTVPMLMIMTVTGPVLVLMTVWHVMPMNVAVRGTMSVVMTMS